MDETETLIIGAGVSGLSLASQLRGDYLILEADTEIGGYCKTVRRAGFVWDYSGHFFHFRYPHIAQWFRQRMTGQRVAQVQKCAYIQTRTGRVDFPFQKNIHQLPKEVFTRCLHDLYFAQHGAAQERPAPENFLQMLYERYGRGISEQFLIPYNQKLYACDLRTLDPNAMGRFFPHVDFAEVVRNMQAPDNHSYNSVFSYPAQGAFAYVRALASEVEPDAICLPERLVAIDVPAHRAHTDRRTIRYRRLVSTMPFNHLLQASGLPHDPSIWTSNQVQVFNLGFDRKGEEGVHWLYFPDPEISFYRVGFYDNILAGDRLSLYVEIGLASGVQPDVQALQQRVLDDLNAVGIVTEQRLIASHHVRMDPAYVHITGASQAAHARLSAQLAEADIYSIGRYGSWTYCSIEDNVVQAWALQQELQPEGRGVDHPPRP